MATYVYDPAGRLNIVVGSAGTGAYTPNGYRRCTDQTANASRIPLIAPDGSMNITILLSETSRVPLYAPNGSMNCVHGAAGGLYSPCGALNVTLN